MGSWGGCLPICGTTHGKIFAGEEDADHDEECKQIKYTMFLST